jgi:hypothetical protein
MEKTPDFSGEGEASELPGPQGMLGLRSRRGFGRA